MYRLTWHEQKCFYDTVHKLKFRELYYEWLWIIIMDHPQSGVVYDWRHVCLSDDNFRKPWRMKFIFAHPVYLQAVQIKFVYEGHRVKVKVTGAKYIENPYSRNVQLPSSITPLL